MSSAVETLQPDEQSHEVLLEVTGVKKHFGGLMAVESCSLTLRRHEVAGLIGPNGAGKSTVLDLLSGVERLDAGHVVLRGENVDSHATHARARMGMVRTFQDPRVWPRLTVLENMLVVGDGATGSSGLRTILRHRRVMAEQHAHIQRAVELLVAVDLESMTDRRAGELSGGQSRLLAFARLAMARPEVVLLDEPLAGVNPVLGERLLGLIREMATAGAAVLVVEHNLAAVEELCDVVYVMSQGEVIGMGTMEELRHSEQVVHAYLGPAVEVI